MPVFDKKARNHRCWRRRWINSALFVGLVTLIGGCTLVASKLSHSVYVQPEQFAIAPMQHFRAARKAFPFSVVPGGIYEPKELVETMKFDPVIRKHYNGIKVDGLVPMRIQNSLQAFVSYRVGDNIYWTTKKLQIPRGELVLTDGANMIRARCGNRIAKTVAKSEVRSSGFGDDTLETVFESPLPSLDKLPPFLQPVVLPGTVSFDHRTDTQNSLAATPEPATLALYTSGIFLMLTAALWRRRGTSLKARYQVNSVPALLTHSQGEL